jgi:NADH:ubiquinone oxidoreductase subunit H
MLAYLHKRQSPAVSRGAVRLLQPIADRAKLLLKEPNIPSKAKSLVFVSRPVYSFTVALCLLSIATPDIFPTAHVYIEHTLIALLSGMSIAGYRILISYFNSNNKVAVISALKSVMLTLCYSLSLTATMLGPLYLSKSVNMINNIVINSIQSPFWVLLLFHPLFFN